MAAMATKAAARAAIGGVPPFALRPGRIGHRSPATAALPRGAELNAGIASFYDESSSLWESVWGEHMHHGYYAATTNGGGVDHRRAQVEMINRVLAFADVAGNSQAEIADVLDVGCGE